MTITFLPFDNNILSHPTDDQKWLATGLTQQPSTDWKNQLDIFTPWRPHFLAFTNAGFHCFPEWETKKDYDGGFLELGKHKGLNQNNFIDLLTRVKAGGTIIVSGDKTAGSAPMLKWVSAMCPIADKLSKNHGVVFWFNVPDNLDYTMIEKLRTPAVQFEHELTTTQQTFTTTPGMFSHGRVDVGSQMLVPHISKALFGKTADFGAGWGYLSSAILQANDKVTNLDIYEADFAALKIAKYNVSQTPSTLPVAYHWFDLASEPITEIYDTVISNPPFHEGRSADATLGQRFIEVASKRLKTGGCLVLVANRQLPYEAILNSLFRKVFVLEDAKGFKIIEARK